MTVNAGEVAPTHWTQDPQTGGGRLLGECCHFIDLIRYLADAPIASHRAVFLDAAVHDSATITLEFADGSVGAIHYFANGSKAFPKERLEIFAAGRVLQLDNFRRLRAFGWPGFTGLNLWRQDKGQQACVRAFVEAVQKGRASPIPFDEIVEVTRVSIEVAESVCRT
jgi:predicted dehydrogenase